MWEQRVVRPRRSRPPRFRQANPSNPQQRPPPPLRQLKPQQQLLQLRPRLNSNIRCPNQLQVEVRAPLKRHLPLPPRRRRRRSKVEQALQVVPLLRRPIIINITNPVVAAVRPLRSSSPQVAEVALTPQNSPKRPSTARPLIQAAAPIRAHPDLLQVHHRPNKTKAKKTLHAALRLTEARPQLAAVRTIVEASRQRDLLRHQ